MAYRKRRTRMRTPRRSGDWFAAAVPVGPTNIAAATLIGQGLLSSFDEPVTVVRLVGSIVVTPQADVAMTAHWGIYVEPVAGVTNLDPSSSADVAKEQWMHWQAMFTSSSTLKHGNSYLPIDIRVKRKMKPESLLNFVIKAQQASSYILNLRAYVLLA